MPFEDKLIISNDVHCSFYSIFNPAENDQSLHLYIIDTRTLSATITTVSTNRKKRATCSNLQAELQTAVSTNVFNTYMLDFKPWCL